MRWADLRAVSRLCVEELAGLMRKTAGAAEILLEAVAPLRPDVALIFGSIARGTETAGSDADLLLIGDIGFAEAVRATYPAQAKLGREINPVVHSAAEFKRRAQAGDPFIHDVMGNKKIFLIGTEHDLGELAGHPAPASV